MKKLLLFSLCCFFLSWCLWHEEDINLEQNNSDDTWLVLEHNTFSAFWVEPFWDLDLSWNEVTFFEMSMEDYENKISIPVTVKVDGWNYYFQWSDIEWSFVENDCLDWWKGDTHYYTVNVSYDGMNFEGCWDDERGVKYSEDEMYEDYDLNSTVDLSWIEWFVKNCEHDPYWVDRSKVIENLSFTWNSKVNLGKSYKVEWVMNYLVDGESYTDNVECVFNSDDVWWDFVEYYSILRKVWKTQEELSCLDGLDAYAPEWMDWDPQTIITVWCWPEAYGDYYVTWYYYTSTYPDLWLRITTPAWYDSFHNKATSSIFKRDGNRISYMVRGEEREYLQVFDKKATENLEDIIAKKHLNKWCVANESNYFGQDKVLADYPWTYIYDIFDKSWAMPWECLPDDEQKAGDEWNWRSIWYFESKDKTKYYKVAFTDGCAPWPCSIFWTIELL